MDEFRWLWLADVQSLLGDQVARVALSVLVFSRTGSGFATAAVYALTYLPALVGGVLLGPLADRVPRRRLLVLGDLARAALLAVMAVPGVPLPALAGLLVLAVLVGAPWSAAESALVADVLSAEHYPVGVAWRGATSQAAQLAGFAAGGGLVALVGPGTALAVDAATFALSALVIRLGVRARPAASGVVGSSPPRARWLSGVATVLRDRRLRVLLGFSWLLGLLVVPEGLAAPYVAQLGGGPGSLGLLLAASPAGVLVGTLVFGRWVPPAARGRLLAPLAVLAGLPLLGCAAEPGLPVTALLWAASGAATAYQVQVVTEFVRTVPAAARGQGIGLASAGLLGAQGAGLLAAGALTEALDVTTTVAVAGAAASATAALLAAARRRASLPTGPTAG
ncbi:MFS transporter [Rhodococcus aerolatus]